MGVLVFAAPPAAALPEPACDLPEPGEVRQSVPGALVFANATAPEPYVGVCLLPIGETQSSKLVLRQTAGGPYVSGGIHANLHPVWGQTGVSFGDLDRSIGVGYGPIGDSGNSYDPEYSIGLRVSQDGVAIFDSEWRHASMESFYNETYVRRDASGTLRIGQYERYEDPWGSSWDDPYCIDQGYELDLTAPGAPTPYTEDCS